ncbi:MAG: DUF6056 family protein [Hydrotalea sp.]|nr:DUF6056 family protein [Hydrotalea sp.]
MRDAKNNKDKQRWLWAIALLLPVFIYISVVSYFTPIMEDDYIKGNGNDFFALKEAWQTYKGYYFGWGGRINSFIYTFFGYSFYRAPFEENFSQIILSGLNGLVFVSFLISLFLLAFARKPIFNDKNDRLRLFIIFLLMMTILAEKGETIFWLNGRATYLWSTTILSWLAVLYRLAFAHDKFLTFKNQSSKHWLFIVAVMPLATIAGMTDYVGVVVVLGLITIGFIYKIFFIKKKLPLWCWTTFLCFIIGVVILITAPGNHLRYISPEYVAYRALPLFEKIVGEPLHGFRIFLHETFLLPILLLPIFYYWQKHITINDKGFLRRLVKKMKKDKAFGMATIYLLSTFGFIAIAAISPAHYSRTWFAGTAIFLLACLLVIDFVFLSPNQKALSIIIRKNIFLISSILFSIYLLYILLLTLGFHEEFKARVQSIITQKNQGKDTILITPYSPKYMYSRRFGAHRYAFWNWEPITSEWGLGAMANYYGVKKIIMEKNK